MKLKNLTISTLALILMTACGDNGTGDEPDDLVGTWTSTALVFTSTADPTLSVDVVAVDGAAATLVLAADATYTFIFTLPSGGDPHSPEEPAENEAGTYTVTGNNLNLTQTGATTYTMEMSRNGDTMTLTLPDTWDFNGDGVEEPATLVATLTR